jgi:hypothetical protein
LRERVDTLTTLRKLIYPCDLQGTVIGYDEQEGSAILVESHITDTAKAQLQEIRINDGKIERTLLDILTEQLAIAKEIMTLVRQRKTLEGTHTTSPLDERNARNAWFESTRTLVSNLRLAVRNGGAPQVLVDSLLQELNDAEDEERRERAKKKVDNTTHTTSVLP